MLRTVTRWSFIAPLPHCYSLPQGFAFPPCNHELDCLGRSIPAGFNPSPCGCLGRLERSGDLDSVSMGFRSGTMVMGIAAFHCGATGLRYLEAFVSTVRSGGFNAVGSHNDRAAMAWFNLAGLSLGLIGWLMNRYERDTQRPLPEAAGWGLLAINGIGAFLMPAGGFYLFMAPCGQIIYRARGAEKLSAD